MECSVAGTTTLDREWTNDGLPEISKKKYGNRIPEPGTTISGFADSKKKEKKRLMPIDRPTLDFFLHVTVNTQFFFGLVVYIVIVLNSAFCPPSWLEQRCRNIESISVEAYLDFAQAYSETTWVFRNRLRWRNQETIRATDTQLRVPDLSYSRNASCALN
jgi:hypothetical protein